MQLIKPNTNINFMGHRRTFGLISAVVVVASVVAVFFPGPKYGIDFSGGTQIQIRFDDQIDIARIRQALAETGYENAGVVAFGDRQGEYLITVQETSPVTAEQETAARERLSKAFSKQGLLEDSFVVSSSGDRLQVRFGEEVDLEVLERELRGSALRVRDHRPGESAGSVVEGEERVCDAPVCRLLPLSENKYEADLVGVGDLVLQGLRDQLGAENVSEPDRVIYVGPKVGRQLKTAGIMSVLYALGFIMLYIAIRFDLRFAPGAVVALLHDIAITMGIFVLFRVEFSLPIIAALLTIIGYSLNDTIVVFDRIRENFQKLRERELSLVINQSINETLSRTLLTSMTTLITVGAIFWLGGGLIRDFALALIIGVLIGTYSSVFVASPVVVYLDRRFFRKQASA
jgi:preprotein translocase subunit SecF